MGAAPQYDVYQAVADPTRRRIMQLLAGKEMPVTVISDQFAISRTAVSKHLRILREAGVVASLKAGRETRYRLQPDALLELKDWLSYFDMFWDNKLAALKRQLEMPEPSDD